MPLEFFYNPILKATTALGVPVPLAKAYFYAAGSSSTLQNTYADSGQISANANPVVADANGLFPDIFLLPLAYHVVIKDTTDTITYFDQDNLAGPLFSALFDDSWQLKDNLDPTKILKFQLSGLTTGTTRTLTIPDASDTIAVLALAQTLAAKTLTGVLGIQMGAAQVKEAQGAGVNAANDLTLGSDGNCFVVAGNTQINRIATGNWQNGSAVFLQFTGTPTVKNAIATGGGFAQIVLNGGVDFVAAANNTLTLRLLGGTWLEQSRKV